MFTYRSEVLRELERHGVRPRPHTNPEVVRSYVRELYKYEIRQLRERVRRQEFSRSEYAVKIDALRREYPVLSLQPSQFVMADTPPLEP